MDYNNNSQTQNQKEQFLKKQSKNEDITAEIYSVATMNSTKRLSRERLGMFLALIATFFLSLNCFYAKVILKTYPDDFDSIEFLFMRGLSIIIFGTFQTFYSQQKVLKISELPFRFWFLLRANANFFYKCFMVFKSIYCPNNNFIKSFTCFTFKLYIFKRTIILEIFSWWPNVYWGLYDYYFKRKKIE